MKLLNLDDLGGEVRKVVLNGVEHEIKDQTIQQLINSVKNRKVARTGDEAADTEEMFNSLVKSAQDLLPTAPKREIVSLNLKQLQALVSYASASSEELEEATEEEVTEGKQEAQSE